MTTVMSDPFSAGVAGNTFNADGIYSNIGGTHPTYVADPKYGVGIQFAAAAISTADETFTGTTQRVFDRVLLWSGTPTTASDFFECRTAGGNTCKAGVTTAGKLQLKDAAGTALTAGTSAATMPIGTRFRLVLNMNGTSWTAVIYNNDTDGTVQQALNPTGTITSASPILAREGSITGTFGAGISLTYFWPMDGDTVETGLRPVWGPWQSPPRRRLQPVRLRPVAQLVLQPLAVPAVVSARSRRPAALVVARRPRSSTVLQLLAVPAVVSARSRRPAALVARRPRSSTLPLVAQVTAPVVFVPQALRRRLTQLVARRRPAAPLPSFLPATLASAPRPSRRPQLFGRRPRTGFVPPVIVTATPPAFVPGSPRPRRLLVIRRRAGGSQPFTVATVSTPTLFQPAAATTRRARLSPRRSTATWTPPSAVPVSVPSLLLQAPRRLARLLTVRRPVPRPIVPSRVPAPLPQPSPRRRVLLRPVRSRSATPVPAAATFGFLQSPRVRRRPPQHRRPRPLTSIFGYVIAPPPPGAVMAGAAATTSAMAGAAGVAPVMGSQAAAAAAMSGTTGTAAVMGGASSTTSTMGGR